MKSILSSLILLFSSSHVYAEACMFIAGEGQVTDNVSCLENRGAPADIFEELCANGGDETMKSKTINKCPENSLGKCVIKLSISKGEVTQYTYSKDLLSLYKMGCNNHPLGEGIWSLSTGTY